MLSRFFGSISTPGVRLSEADIKLVLSSYKDALEKQTGQTLYATNSGVSTISGIQNRLDELLSGNGRTSYGLLSSQLGLEQNILKPLINETKVPIYQNDSTIFCKGEVERIRGEIAGWLEEASGVLDAIQFCVDNSLDMSTLKNMIAGSQIACTVLEDMVISDECLRITKEAIIEELRNADSPIKLSELSSDSPSPDSQAEVNRNVNHNVNRNVWKQLLSSPTNKWLKNCEEIDGSIDGYGVVFTPNAYKEKAQQLALNKLLESGTLKVSAFQQVGVKDVVKFCKLNEVEAILLDQVVVVRTFLDNETERHAKALEEHKWTKMFYELPLADEEVLIQKHIIPKLSSKTIYWKDKSFSYLLAHSLIASISKEASARLETQATTDAEAIIASCKKSKTRIDAEDVALKETTKNVTELSFKEEFLGEFSAEPAVQKFLTSKILKQAKDAYLSTARRILKAYTEQEDKLEDVKLVVYWNGVDSVQPYDDKTFAVLHEELVNQYIHRPTTEYAEEDLMAFQRDQVAKYKKRLETAKDGTTVILLAVSIVYSEFLTHKLHKPVFLKVTGKYVPKLLKILEAAGAGLSSELGTESETGAEAEAGGFAVDLTPLTSLKNAVRQKLGGDNLNMVIRQVKDEVLGKTKTNNN